MIYEVPELWVWLSSRGMREPGEAFEACRSTWLPLIISIIFSVWMAALDQLKGRVMVLGSTGQNNSEIPAN